jgi:small subunit ribosomal protein S9
MTKEAKKYVEGIGRRKTSVARVRVTEGKGDVIINDKKLEEFFTVSRLRDYVLSPLKRLGIETVGISVHVNGGGIAGQAQAIRHGLARAIVIRDEGYKGQLRSLGFLTRDSRAVERKKYGLKKARKSPQWSKR